MQLEKKLDAMKGNKYLVASFEHTFQNYEIVNDELTIVTDKKFIKVPVKGADKLLESFLPVSENKSGSLIQSEPPSPEMMEIYNSAKADLPGLRKIVMDNIQKIQTDRSFIPQAQATNESINAIANMLKLELQVMKMRGMKIK